MLGRLKWLSLLLVFSILFLAVAPQVSLAASSNQNPSTSDGISPYLQKNVTRIYELVDKRDRTTKYYQNSDGSITAESTIKPRHYKDNQGKWQDISNNIVPSDDPAFTLRNGANSFQTYFANNSQPNLMTKIKIDQNTFLGWNLNNSNKVSAINDSNSVTYPDIQTSTNLQYLPNWDGLKENIILKDINAPNAFRFDITTNGLIPVQQSDGSIALQDAKSGETKAVLPKPFIFDQNKQVSQSVTMTISSTQSPNVYALFITADLNWLNDPARAYPVVIDPNFTTATPNSNPFGVGNTNNDTYIASNSSNEYYLNNYMTTGHDVNLGTTRSLVKFNLPSIPTGSLIVGSTFQLYKTNNNVNNSTNVNVSRITSSWDPTTVNWTYPPTIDNNNTLTTTAQTYVGATTTGYINFDVWSIVKSWYNGYNVQNYGFEIYNQDETNTYFTWSSSDAGTNVPLLSVTYISDLLGVNPQWSYANTPVGSVNTVNGNFISSVKDYSLPGRGIPVKISRTYNSRANYSGLLFGPKWISNLDMQLQINSWGIVYLDSVGTEHSFFLQGDGTYKAQDNYPVQVYKTTGANGHYLYTIQEAYTDPTTGQVVYAKQDKLPSLVFDNNPTVNNIAQLTQLNDGKGNITQISWNTGNLTVTDPSGRIVTISQNPDGTANQVTTSMEAGKVKVSYGYTSGQLSSVTYDNGTYPSTSIKYGWNSGLISSMTDKSGVTTYLTYNGNNQIISTGPVNMLPNPSLEAYSNPTFDNWTNTIQSDNGTISQSTTAKYGGHSMDIQSSYMAGTTSDSYLYVTQKVPVAGSQAYNLSSFIKTVNLGGSSTPNPSVAKAFLNIEQLDSTGTHLAWNDNRTAGISGSIDWTQSNLSITTLSNTAYVVVYLEVQHDNAHFGGDAYFDGVQLEQGQSASNFQGHTDFRYFTDAGYQACLVTKPAGESVEYKNNNYGTPAAVIKDPNGLKAETDMVWDASDHLKSLTTPNHNTYSYSYDSVGNLISATDPLGNPTSMNYYYNRLQTLTQADNGTVQNIWDPANLNNNTNINQTGNSRAYTYDAGNMTTESNQLGIADNRVLDSDFESPSNPVAPTFTRSSSAYQQNGTVVSANTPRYETGKYGQAVTVEEGTTNLLNSQGGGASTNWTLWSHWGNRSYWSSETQTSDPNYGNVYAGVNANSTGTYLFDYYPYTVTSGTAYTISVMLKSSQNWTGSTTDYMARSSDNSMIGSTSQTISLTTSWQKFTWTITPNQSLTASAGIGIKFAGLPAGVTLYAARPQLEQLAYATSFTDSTRSGETLTIPNSVFTPTQGTIEAWVNPSRNPGQAIQMITDVAETGNNGLILALNTDGRFYIQAGTGSGVTQAYSTTIATQGNWYDVVGKWDGTGVSIYVNGVKQGTTAGSPNVILSSTPTIGRESQTVLRWFDGLIDDVRISSIARTDTDIQNGYNSGQALPVDSYTTYKLNLDNNLNVGAASFQPDNWSAYTPSGSINQVEYDNTAPFGGSRVLHINPGSNANSYQWSTAYIPVTADPYTLSGYIRTNGSSTTNGAVLSVYWYDANMDYPPLRIDANFNLKSTASWQRYIATLTPPTGAAYAKVTAINYGPMDAYFDNIQFEQSPQVRGYNFLDDSSFERGSGKWTTSDSYSSIINDGSNAYSGSFDAQISLPSTGSSYLESQTVIPVSQGQSYSLTGFITTSGMNAASGNGARFHVLQYDTSGNHVTDYYLPAINSNKNWTKYILTFKPTVAGTVKVRLEMTNASGTAKFDIVRLSAGQLISTTTYDTNKNYVTNTTDQLQNPTNYVNDLYGQATSVTTPGGEETQYGYDGQEELRTVTDNANNVTTYSLDANGNVLEVSLSDGTNLYNHTWSTYDNLGHLISEKDANNNTTQYAYDEEGRMKLKTSPDGSTISYSYDSLGRFSQVQSSGGDSSTYGYDLDSNLTNVQVFSGGTLKNEFVYTYNAVDKLYDYSEKDGNHNIVAQANTLTYDQVNRLKGFNLVYSSNAAIPYTFNYLQNGAVSNIKFGPNNSQFVFNYDDGDNLINKINPNNTEDIYTYNEANQIVGTQTAGVSVSGQISTLTSKWSNQYSYSSDGLLTSVTQSGQISSSANYTYNNGTEKLNRLTQANITVGSTPYTFNYSYDPAGNLLSMAVPNGTTTTTNTFQYDGANRITAINSDSTAVSYDSNGNLTKLTVNGKTYQYVFDNSNRLTTVKDGTGAVIASYTYDQDGKRLTKTVGTTITTYHYFQGELMYETLNTDPSNVIHALYVRSPKGSLQAVALNYTVGGTNTSNLYYYHYNVHGDVIGVTDYNGNLFRQYFYDPYGNVISVEDGSGNSVDINNDSGFNNAYTYAGYRFDSESGLYFLNSRYYAAGIGRFLTKDTFKGVAKDPGSLNRYAYSKDDPVNNSDPSGYVAGVDDLIELGLAVAALAETPEGQELIQEGEITAEELFTQVEKLAGSYLNHLNGAIAEAQGFSYVTETLGQVPIEAPGSITAVGPDFITFDSINDEIVVWDAKYSFSQNFPSTASGFGSQKWLNMIQEAINNIQDSNLQQTVQNAFDNGNIDWRIFSWPK